MSESLKIQNSPILIDKDKIINILDNAIENNPSLIVGKTLDINDEAELVPVVDNSEDTVETNCLVKTKNIKPQSTKTAKERQIDIKNVFTIQNVDKIKNKKLLLLDDIYTTGATVTECIKELQKANVKKIGIMTLAKD